MLKMRACDGAHMFVVRVYACEIRQLLWAWTRHGSLTMRRNPVLFSEQVTNGEMEQQDQFLELGNNPNCSVWGDFIDVSPPDIDR